MAGAITMTVVGNLTGDPEVRQVGGANVANFTVAVTDRRFDKQANEWVDGSTTFIRCQAWRELADHVQASLTKGTRVVAQGTFAQRDYETREGEKKSSFELTVEEIGPSLRYALAQVTRAGGNRNQGQRREQYAQQQAPAAPRGQRAPTAEQQEQQWAEDGSWAGGDF